MLLVAFIAYGQLRSQWPAGDAVAVVSMTRSNGPLKLFPSFGGCLLILPDGSLWRWRIFGAMNPQIPPGKPERIGLDTDWSSVSPGLERWLGVKTNGTLWEWSGGLGKGPVRFGTETNWVAAAVDFKHACGLKADGTLWSVTPLLNGDEGRSSQLGEGAGWKAIGAGFGEHSFGLRADGTLWAWGCFPGIPDNEGCPKFHVPAQVCLETNWVGFELGTSLLVRDGAGELWSPNLSKPEPYDPISRNGALFGASARSNTLAVAGNPSPSFYRLGEDGSLHSTKGDRPPSSLSKWSRFGARSDWLSVWSINQGTALGLTSDGTLWQWGTDPFKHSEPGLLDRLKLLRNRVYGFLGLRPVIFPIRVAQVYHEEPQPVLRMMFQP